MNTKASLAIIAAVTALSSHAFAGELYGSAERTLNAPVSASVAPTAVETDSSVSSNGEIYAAANEALSNAAGSASARLAPVTSLAVGGELGSPQGKAFYGESFRDESALAE